MEKNGPEKHDENGFNKNLENIFNKNRKGFVEDKCEYQPEEKFESHCTK